MTSPARTLAPARDVSPAGPLSSPGTVCVHLCRLFHDHDLDGGACVGFCGVHLPSPTYKVMFRAPAGAEEYCVVCDSMWTARAA